MQVSDSYRQRFLGRYEEMGEDLHIISLEVKKVAFENEEKARLAIVELEQQWYREPNMTVKKDKLIERWERTAQGWRLAARMTKKEYRDQKERQDTTTPSSQNLSKTSSPLRKT